MTIMTPTSIFKCTIGSEIAIYRVNDYYMLVVAPTANFFAMQIPMILEDLAGLAQSILGYVQDETIRRES